MIDNSESDKMDCRGYKEIVAAHIDDALSRTEKRSVEFHLKECPKCARIFHWETRATRALKERLSLSVSKPGLRQRLLDRLEEKRGAGIFGWFYGSHGQAAAFALLVLFVLPYLLWTGRTQDNILANAVVQYQDVVQGYADLSSQSLPSTSSTRFLDLSPWGYRVLTQQSLKVTGQAGRLIVYQGPENAYLLAQEFEGANLARPPAAQAVRSRSHEFVIYAKEGVNLIAWKEKDKDLLCILVSALPQNKLLDLAQQVAGRS
jgi:hypothetical protein